MGEFDMLFSNEESHAESILQNLNGVFQDDDLRFSIADQNNNQEVARNGMAARGHRKPLQVSTSSVENRSVCSEAVQGHLAQPQTPDESKRERKKIIDQLYRQRVKCKRDQMTQELGYLKLENQNLMCENEDLTAHNSDMKQTLQSQENEIKQLRIGLGQLKRKCDKQDSLVEALSQKLARSEDNNYKHEKERHRVRQGLWSTSANPSEQIKGLTSEIASLKHDKRMLEVKVEALCEKIYNDRSHEDEHAISSLY